MLQALSAAGWAGGCGAGQAGPEGRSDAPECGATMPWFPVKKVRKQMKLLLLLLLLTCAAWLTYVHRSLVRPGRALRQRLGYGRGTRWRGARGHGAPKARGSDCPEPLLSSSNQLRYIGGGVAALLGGTPNDVSSNARDPRDSSLTFLDPGICLRSGGDGINGGPLGEPVPSAKRPVRPLPT